MVFGCPKLLLFQNMTQNFFNNLKILTTFAFNKQTLNKI